MLKRFFQCPVLFFLSCSQEKETTQECNFSREIQNKISLLKQKATEEKENME